MRPLKTKTKLSPTLQLPLINFRLRPPKKTSTIVGEVIQQLESMLLR